MITPDDGVRTPNADSTAPAVLDSKTFPGRPDAVADVRRFVRRAVIWYGLDVADTCELLASEVSTNALLHSRSGGPGGRFEVTVAADDRTLRVQVLDQGATGRLPHVRPAGDGAAEHGHGLVLVTRLATRWGVKSPHSGGTLTWFEITLDDGAVDTG